MTTTRILSEWADELLVSRSSMARARERLGIGQRVGRYWLLTAAEAEQVAAEVRSGPGCPLFGKGFRPRAGMQSEVNPSRSQI